MRIAHPIPLGTIFLCPLLHLGTALANPPIPTTQPAATTQEIGNPGPAIVATTQPATAPATAPAAGVATTQPATAPAADPKAVAAQHQKELNEQWRESRRRQRVVTRDRWANAPILQTFKLESLIHLAISDGQLTADAIDIGTIAAARIAVEGSDAIWTISSPNRRVIMPRGFAPVSYINITRFDFNAGDSEYWQIRMMVSGSSLTIFAQNLFANATIFQTPNSILVRASEAQQIGQAQKVLFEARAPSIRQLRSENPAEFRTYVLPLLTKFADPTLLLPGPADVYSAFVEIPADQDVMHAIELLTPALDSDDPNERDAASVKLSQLGKPGVLAALRYDDANLSLEQKIRLRGFVAGYRRRPWTRPDVAGQDLNFLIDCLEYEDKAVRAAAKSALEKHAGHEISFDLSLPPADAANAADALRKRMLAPPPPLPAATAPATQPTPQS